MGKSSICTQSQIERRRTCIQVGTKI